mmetsp:Transcript_50829/g.159933  ORF Transcript_50829/g.159933 Transcript_50829/m.159933 type:complete len:266 (+) Transcript_50829:706-1503(+)
MLCSFSSFSSSAWSRASSSLSLASCSASAAASKYRARSSGLISSTFGSAGLLSGLLQLCEEFWPQPPQDEPSSFFQSFQSLLFHSFQSSFFSLQSLQPSQPLFQSSFSSFSSLSLPLLPLPLPLRCLERLRRRISTLVSRSSNMESRTFGLAGFFSLASSSFGCSGMDGGGASVTPFVIHEGSVVPRPRPAGPEDSLGGSSGVLAEGPFVIHAGMVFPRPRPAGPLTGESDFSFGLASLAFFGLGSLTSSPSAPSPSPPSPYSPS